MEGQGDRGKSAVGDPPCSLSPRLRQLPAPSVTTSDASLGLHAVLSSKSDIDIVCPGSVPIFGFLKAPVYCALSLRDQSLIKRNRRLRKTLISLCRHKR